MKIDPQWLLSAAAFLGALATMLVGLYAVVTKPLLKRMDDIRMDLAQFREETARCLERIENELKTHGERLARVEERLPPPLVHR